MCTKNLFKVTSFLHIGKDGKPDTWFLNTNSHIEAEKYKPPYYSLQKLPCGQCLECRLEYSKQWATRCLQESKQHEDNVMLTLTYNNENVPKGQKIDKETGEVSESLTLKKKDVQDFMKRLRKKYGKGIKFYMCGEYGTSELGTKRPHYHIICFGLKVEDMKAYKKSKTDYGTHLLYKSKTMDKIWNKGFVDLNEVNYETCAYVARYVTKKQKGKKSKEYYELRGQVPEYTNMSKGIGKEFFNQNKEKIYEKEKIWQKTKKGLEEIKLGRYYDKLMEEDNPEALKKLKNERKQKAEEKTAELLKQTSLTLDEYIQQKHERSERKARQLKRA